METHFQPIEKPFLASKNHFSEMIEFLSSAQTLSHSDIEQYLHQQGHELMRLLFQAHLNQRSAEELSAQMVVGPDNIIRKSKRLQSRQLETLFGTVNVTRLAYGKAGHASLFPLDAELNIPESKYSYGLQRVISSEAALRSFDETLEQLEETVAGHVPKRQAQALMAKAVVDFESFYAQQQLKPEEQAEIVVISLDGKGIVMRPESLKTVKAKPQKINKQPSKGKKEGRKRMAIVSTVYSIAPFKRTPVMVAESLYPSNKSELRPKPVGKQVWATLEKSVKEVVEDCFAQAYQRDPSRKKDWIVLVDGNRQQIKEVNHYAKKNRIKVTLIVDLIHVLEYLWNAAYCFFSEGSAQAKQWVSKNLLQILQGKSSLTAAAMRRSATRQGLTLNARENVDKCARYLLNHKAYLMYDLYLRKGYPISTGVIEGVCRYLVKDRMDRTGARWGLKGAEAVLKMRALKVNDDFEKYWTYHEEKEYQRCYPEIKSVFLRVKPKRGNYFKHDNDWDTAV